MSISPDQAYEQLFAYAEQHGFAGTDPFDGLESRLFRWTGLGHFRFTRLLWLQAVKRSPFDLRSLANVRPGVNPKGIALFALAEIARYRTTGSEEHRLRSGQLIDKLRSLSLKTPGGGIAYGYNFDWQSRVFYAPKGTPTVVPSSFAAFAFADAEALGQTYKQDLAGIVHFILNDLRRPVESEDEICFSYTPLDDERIYNASLLAGEVLARASVILARPELAGYAIRAARFAIKAQADDGSWFYGEGGGQRWIDNFHTAYVLSSLLQIAQVSEDATAEIMPHVIKGTEYWIANLFEPDGAPKYFNKTALPYDIHSAAAAVTTLCDLATVSDVALPLAEKILEWTFINLRDANGSFYYQKWDKRIIRTPFMRWGQAWMAYAIARFIEARNQRLGPTE